MNTALTAIIISCGLLVAVLLGQFIRIRLPEHHLSSDTRDSVKLAVGMVATMAALLLGLLVSSAKGTYDTERGEVLLMASKAAYLDRSLAVFGPETMETRLKFRAAVAQTVRQLWPESDGTKANMAPDTQAGNAIFAALESLSPQNDLQRAGKSQAVSAANDLAQLRMLLMTQSVPSISHPLLLMVVGWLVVIFLSFSVLAPPNAMARLALAISALSVAGALFLILELDQPFAGLIRIPSGPMQMVLDQLAK
jgi:hypothetical protein